MDRRARKLHKTIMTRFEDAKKQEGYEIAQADEDKTDIFYIRLHLTEGRYRGQTHIIQFKTVYGANVKKQFPNDSPNIVFLTKIFHPNISSAGSVCVDILTEPDKWSNLYGFHEVINSIIVLLDDPNNKSPYNTTAAQMYKRCAKAYANVKKSEAAKLECFKEFDEHALAHATTKVDQWDKFFTVEPEGAGAAE